jgi:hypothetical protein
MALGGVMKGSMLSVTSTSTIEAVKADIKTG